MYFCPKLAQLLVIFLCFGNVYALPTKINSGSTPTTTTNPTPCSSPSDTSTSCHVQTTTSPSPSPSPVNSILLIAIVVICSTVIVVALCCGCICLIKMRYRFSALRMNFYTRNLFNRNHADTNVPPGSNDYKDMAGKGKIEYDRWEMNPKNLVINEKEKLGSGAFASVFKGNLKGKNPLIENSVNINFALEMNENVENEVAVKMLHAHADDENRADLLNEIAFMKTLGYHPHVVNLIGCVTSLYDPLLIVEYCAYGDLLKLLRKHREDLIPSEEGKKPADPPEFVLAMRELLSFAWQISDGLVYLSSRNFIHRDVAARNVLLTKRMVAKISDFGLCRYSEVALYTTKGGKLPIKWMAIEALKQAEFTSKTDVWAYGVLLYELFTMGDTPYHSIQPTEMTDYLLAGNRLEQPNLCPDEMYELMRECWAERPEQRPTFEQIRQRIAAFLDVSSDSYGYVQVSATEYQRIYVTVKPGLGENAPSTSKEIETSFENQDEAETSFISDPDSGNRDAGPPMNVVQVETSSISRSSGNPNSVNRDAGPPMNVVQVETSSISRSSSIYASSEDGVNKTEEELIVYDDDVL